MKSIVLTLLPCLLVTAAMTAEEVVTLKPAEMQLFRPYQLKTCLVSGDPIGEMGVGMSTIYKGLEITFCCKPCIRTFAKKPDHFLAEMKKAEAAAASTETAKPAAPAPKADEHAGHAGHAHH